MRQTYAQSASYDVNSIFFFIHMYNVHTHVSFITIIIIALDCVFKWDFGQKKEMTISNDKLSCSRFNVLFYSFFDSFIPCIEWLLVVVVRLKVICMIVTFLPFSCFSYVPTRLWGFSGHFQTVFHSIVGRVKCPPWPLGERIYLSLEDGSTLTYDLYQPSTEIDGNNNNYIPFSVCTSSENDLQNCPCFTVWRKNTIFQMTLLLLSVPALEILPKQSTYGQLFIWLNATAIDALCWIILAHWLVCKSLQVEYSHMVCIRSYCLYFVFHGNFSWVIRAFVYEFT